MCDDSTRDALVLTADGSVKAYYPITSLDDGNCACSLLAINSAATVFAVLNGFGAVEPLTSSSLYLSLRWQAEAADSLLAVALALQFYRNGSTTGTLDGTTIYLFNVQTGAVNKVAVASNTDYYGVAGMAIDDSSNIYVPSPTTPTTLSCWCAAGQAAPSSTASPPCARRCSATTTRPTSSRTASSTSTYWPNAQGCSSVMQWD